MIKTAWILLFCLSFSQNSYATQRTAKETAIDRLVVTRFAVNLKNKKNKQALTQFNPKFQSMIAQKLETKSYLKTTQFPKSISTQRRSKDYKKIAKLSGADGILAGAIDDKAVRIVLRSGSTGRRIAIWTHALPQSLNKKTMTKLAQKIVDSVVVTFPYRGFIVGRRRDEVKINLGKKQALKKGALLNVFEFQGKKPTLTSEKRKLGQVKIVKIGKDAAVAKIKNKSKKLPLYSKIAFNKNSTEPPTEVNQRYFDGMWGTLGTDFVFIDSYPSERNGDLDQRLYQLTLSPFLVAGFGWNKFVSEIKFGSGESDNNTVQFIMSEMSYEVFSYSWKNLGFIASPGVYYSNYTSSQKPDTELPLTNQTTTTGMIEGRLQWDITPRARVFGNFSILYPVISSDPVNGSSSMQSNGSKGGLGLRIDLSNHVSVEQVLGSQFIRYFFEDLTTVEESHFSLNTRLMVNF